MGEIEPTKVLLDKHSPLPLYYQLEAFIDHLIESGEFSPGEMIPSENQFCKQFNISRTTVRQAINNLVNSGKLVRTQGRGTFVAKSRIEKPTYRLAGFNQDMKEMGIKPGTKILQFSPVLPPSQVRSSLQMEENEVAIYIEVLRFADNQVVGLDTSYYPFKRFFKILDEDLNDRSVYQVLRQKFDTYPTRYTYQIEADNCPREIANHLELNPSDIVLHVFGVVYDQNDAPYEFSEEYYRADRYAFRAEVLVKHNERFGGIRSKK